MSPWLTDIRKAALVALVAAVFGGAYRLWNASRRARSQFADFSWSSFPPHDIPWILALLALGLALSIFVTVIWFGFFVALYRSKVGFRISVGLRRLALLAAAVSTLELLWSLFRWMQFYWTQFPQRGAVASLTVFIFDQLSGLAYNLFLISIFRYTGESLESDNGKDRFLRQVAEASVVLWSLVLVGIVAGAIYLAIAFDYPHYRILARLYGRNVPSLGSDFVERAYYFLQFTLLWVPPFIINRSLRVKRELVEIPPESV